VALLWCRNGGCGPPHSCGRRPANRWYESEAHQEAMKLREGAAHLRAVAVQGVD
jgi:hypothetical protein